jgi:magnesium transporter
LIFDNQQHTGHRFATKQYNFERPEYVHDTSKSHTNIGMSQPLSGGVPVGNDFSTGSNGHSGLDERQWNALIGIISAIVGNILISFALNIQRYAHLRINRDEAAWRERSRRGTGISDYGTQAKIAEERANINLRSSQSRSRTNLRGEYDESTPLHDDGRRSSSASSNTLGQKNFEEPGLKKNYLKSPWWWAGIILMTVGEAGNFLA